MSKGLFDTIFELSCLIDPAAAFLVFAKADSLFLINNTSANGKKGVDRTPKYG